LYVGVGRGLNEGASELCISEVWSVENSMVCFHFYQSHITW